MLSWQAIHYHLSHLPTTIGIFLRRSSVNEKLRGDDVLELRNKNANSYLINRRRSHRNSGLPSLIGKQGSLDSIDGFCVVKFSYV